MPLRKPGNDDTAAPAASQPFPPEAYQYEAKLTVEKVKRIQEKAETILAGETWTVIDGVDDKR